MSRPHARMRASTIYLLAHGSEDPRHAEDVEGIAHRLASATGRRVLPCYLDHCGPDLTGVADAPGVVVPLLFSPGYHARVDVADAVAAAHVPLSVARPPVLTGAAAWGRQLLAEMSEYRQASPTRPDGQDAPAREHRGRQISSEGASPPPVADVIWVTAGSRDPAVLRAWDETAAALGVPIVHASGPGARLSSVAPRASADVVPLVVARGYFSDVIARQAAAAGLPTAPPAGTSGALITELIRRAAQAPAAAA